MDHGGLGPAGIMRDLAAAIGCKASDLCVARSERPSGFRLGPDMHGHPSLITMDFVFEPRFLVAEQAK